MAECCRRRWLSGWNELPDFLARINAPIEASEQTGPKPRSIDGPGRDGLTVAVVGEGVWA